MSARRRLHVILRDAVGLGSNDIKILLDEFEREVATGEALRDKLAMAALTGLTTTRGSDGWTSLSWQEIVSHDAKAAYDYADAMLAARAEKREETS